MGVVDMIDEYARSKIRAIVSLEVGRWSEMDLWNVVGSNAI
jgi:hypothetical protein